jgi:hypothetical protein
MIEGELEAAAFDFTDIPLGPFSPLRDVASTKSSPGEWSSTLGMCCLLP